MTKLILSLFCLASVSAFAAGPREEALESLPECSKVVAACKAAGYEPGAHKTNRKGLWIDCIGARARNRAVAGLESISQDDAKACGKAARGERRAEKGAAAPAAKPAGH